MPITVGVRPLTHRRANGGLYARPAEVETTLEALLTLDRATQIERAKILDETDERYVQSECIAYLAREAAGRTDYPMVSALLEVIFKRHGRIIHAGLRSLSQSDGEEAYQDVAGELAHRLIDPGDDRGDFFQVRFALGLKRLILTTLETYVDEARKAAATQRIGNAPPDRTPLSEVPDVDVPDRRALDAAEQASTREELVKCPEALALLDEDVRQAFVLRFAHGWPIESRDENIPTLSRHFGVTPKTIRNWLNEAEATLARWRER